MKHYFQKLAYSMAMLIFLLVTSSCALIVSEPVHPRHRQRVIWIEDVSYRQVYYIHNNNVVIVSQEPEYHKPHKNKKPKGNNGNHHGH
ncbi:MAG: hypothetical protein CVU48_00630 [Candidatus Cloacimonetes bacterium HGW-Cloacimonetes-1]|nr:MAG: hypothetical protein CVU48_00630 [Candidatus Cloacimonetes bacterium HGW-Cloacimonetes-1]